jgi:hypothetical protein
MRQSSDTERQKEDTGRNANPPGRTPRPTPVYNESRAVAKRKVKAKTPKTSPQSRRRRPRYSVGEWFMVVVGALLVIFFAGIVITTILGE